MGGCVSVIVKKSDGQQINMCRWTNVMPYFFSHPELFQQDSTAWYREFSKEWELMRADYERNRGNEIYDNPMTNVYFPSNYSVPIEYGIIAVDLINKKIFSAQDYTEIGAISIGSCVGKNVDEENRKRLEKLFQMGLIKQLKYFDNEMNEYKKVSIAKLNWKELNTVLEHIVEYGYFTKKPSMPYPLQKINPDFFEAWSTQIIIDSNFEIIHFSERLMGSLQVKKLMISNGFTFTSEDDLKWKSYFKNYFEEEKPNKEFTNLYLKVFNETWQN